MNDIKKVVSADIAKAMGFKTKKAFEMFYDANEEFQNIVTQHVKLFTTNLTEVSTQFSGGIRETQIEYEDQLYECNEAYDDAKTKADASDASEEPKDMELIRQAFDFRTRMNAIFANIKLEGKMALLATSKITPYKLIMLRTDDAKRDKVIAAIKGTKLYKRFTQV